MRAFTLKSNSTHVESNISSEEEAEPLYKVEVYKIIKIRSLRAQFSNTDLFPEFFNTDGDSPSRRQMETSNGVGEETLEVNLRRCEAVTSNFVAVSSSRNLFSPKAL